jgi:type II secretory pathway component PulC
MVDQHAAARSACLVRCTEPPERSGLFHVGDRACEVADIKEIRQDGVVIENLLAKRTELLTFPASAAPGPAPPPPESAPEPAAAPAPGIVAVDLPKDAVARYLADLPGLLESARATPRYRDAGNGQQSIDGYQIDGIRQGSVADQAGLRNGDVVLEVNGQALDGLATVMRVFGELQAAPQAKVTVLRNGQKMTLVLNTK